MDTRFAQHLQSWLTVMLRQKALATATEDAPAPLGVTDLARMLCEYVLQTLTADPRASLTCCGLDDVTDREIAEATGFDRDGVAAALIGAVVELSPWVGTEGTAFLVMHGVPEEDAIEFAHAAEITAEKIGARGQAIVAELSGRTQELTAAV
jgi:hypothetical protein